MTFRGYFALNDVEIANSSRVVAHLGMDVPKNDLGMFGAAADCSLAFSRPNLVVDPAMATNIWLSETRPGVAWDTTGKGLDGRNSIRFNTAGAGANCYTRTNGSNVPAYFPTNNVDQWKITAWVWAPVTNTSPVPVSCMGACTDSTGVNGTAYPAGAIVNVAPGQSLRVSAVIVCPTGRNRIAPQIYTGNAITGQVLHVSDMTVDHLADAPRALITDPAPTQTPIAPGRLLYTPPDGSRLYSSGLAIVGDCWDTSNLCFGCRSTVEYDDSWPGLSDMLDDSIYRPELAPWYTSRVPESGEFGGVWVMDVKGLNVVPIKRDVQEVVGPGGAVTPHRDTSRPVTFEALLMACTSAGLEYGLQWLNCQLRDTAYRNDSVLRYLSAHPGYSTADPQTLMREVHGVVLTHEAQILNSQAGGGRQNQHATVYRVSWELTLLNPYAYLPAVDIDVAWDTIEVQPIEWVHATDCAKPADCSTMPVLFSETCIVEDISVVATPPPSCGGCMPVCQVETFRYEVPVFGQPYRCRETTASVIVRNTGPEQVTLQGYWRRTAGFDECSQEEYPFQIAGLPPSAELHLDAIADDYYAMYDGQKHRPAYILSTPSGAPWRPAIIDRSQAYELVVTAAGGTTFEVSISLADREA